MHHLLGGEKAGLTPPSEDKRSTESKWVRTACQRLAQGDRKARDASQHKALRAAGKENGSGSLDLGVPSPDSTVCLDALCSRLKQAVTAPTARPKRKAVPLPLGECDSPPQQQAHDPPPLHPPPPQTQTQTPTLLPPTSRPRLKAPNPPTPPQPPQPMRLPAPASGSTPPAPPPSPLLLPSVPSPPPASSALDAAAVTADDTDDSSRQGTAVPRRLAPEFGDATAPAPVATADVSSAAIGAATPSLASTSASAEGPASMTPLALPQSSTPSTQAPSKNSDGSSRMCSGCSELQRELQEARQADSDLRVEVAALKREAERQARQQEFAKKAAAGDATLAAASNARLLTQVPPYPQPCPCRCP